MTREHLRSCEYCDTRFVADLDPDSTERFCSRDCLAAAWRGGNPHVFAFDDGDAREFVELPAGGPEPE